MMTRNEYLTLCARSRIAQPDAERIKKLPKSPRQPNGNEQRFRDEWIADQLRRGAFITAEFEARRFKLFTLHYTPDWFCCRPNGVLVCYECKPFYKNTGRVHWHPGSRERLKMAASLYPDIEFYGCWRTTAGWEFERISNGSQ